MASAQVAEIVIRTGEDEFRGGETVYGCIYLNIQAPCSASGVQLKVSGVESYSCDVFNGETTETKAKRREYLLASAVTLYSFKGGSVGLGQYAFPFQVSLPLDIPGSFEATSTCSTQWNASVRYTIEAGLCGDSAIKTEHEILVQQLTKSELSPDEGLTTEHAARIPMPYFRLKQMSFTVNITTDRQVYRQGKEIKIDLKFECKGLVKPKLKRIEVKLLRSFNIGSKRKSASDRSLLCASNDQSDEIFFPENGDWKTLWSSAIIGTVDHSLLSGFQDLYVPLKEDQRMPSIEGEYLQCRYGIEVSVQFSSCSPVVTWLPLPNINLPPATRVDSLPEWMSECSIIHSESTFGVPLRITESNDFARLPSFMTL